MALGAVPVVVLAQCAPQCTPPPTVTYSDVTSLVPVDGVVFELHGTSGRFLTLGGFGDGVRLDLTARTTQPVPFDSALSADGASLVTVVDDDTLELNASTRPQVSLPAGWVIDFVSTPSNGGTVVGVEATNGASADQAAFLVDFAARTALKLDTPLGPNPIGHDSFLPVVSADGTTAAFTFRNGPLGCNCEDVFVWRRSGPLELASASATGTEIGASEAVDISANGRFVLYFTASSSSGSGQLFVRDLTTDTTAPVPMTHSPVPAPDALNAGISDDGDRIALIQELAVSGEPVPLPFPTLYDRSAGTTTVLAPAMTRANSLWSASWIALSGDGKRVAFTTNGTTEPQHVVADIAGG